MTDGGRASSDRLPREVVDLLVEFSTALHKHSMYPPAHPALSLIGATLAARTDAAIGDRERLSIVVARRRLLVDGVASDPAHPLLRRLADTLHAQQLGAVTLEKGVEPSEMAAALACLATAAKLDRPLGLQPPGDMPAWQRIRLHPLRFDHLTLAAGPDAAAAPAESTDALWQALAEAALAGRGTIGDGPASPATIAGAIAADRGADAAIVRCLRQIADALRTAPPREAEGLRARASGLVRALGPVTLRRLVRISRSEDSRAGLVRDAVHGLDVGAVLDILNATADVAGETISDGLARLLAKLAAQATTPGVRRLPADDALRGQVMRLLIDWRLEDPNPELYSLLLAELSATSQRDDEAAPGEASDTDVRLVEMALEMGEFGPLAERAFARAVHAGRIAALVDAVDRAPDADGAAAMAVRERLVAPDVLAVWLSEGALDVERLDRLQQWMTADSYGALLDQLIRSSHRTTRRRLLDRLSAAPCDLTAAIVARLEEAPWYGQRNLLSLLCLRPDRLDGFPVGRWQAHSDWRVRHEALRVGLVMRGARDSAIRRALADAEPRIVAAALRELGTACPASLVAPVAAVAADAGRPVETRVLAVRALGAAVPATAVPALISIVDGGRTFFGRRKLADHGPVVVAALRVLAQRFDSTDQARPFLDLARSSGNPVVREAVTFR